MFLKDKRTVLTLDAGGTNFVFSALKGGKEIIEPIIKPSQAHDLEKCLHNMVDGFNELIKRVEDKPIAISFAFPGPADYPYGIIGDLPNLPAFRGGVALGPYLQKKFGIPVYINNDGDLFAYGEALAGILPELNDKLRQHGSCKQYKNLIGLTLGTGFGCGIIINNELIVGDNSISSEVWLMSNRVISDYNAEEIVSTRSVIAEYLKEAKLKETELMPLDIFQIAKGQKTGNKQAALKAFEFFGRGMGDVIANLITLIDGIVVIGGGIAGAEELYMHALLEELNKPFSCRTQSVSRPIQKVYNYSDNEQQQEFLKSRFEEILIPESNIKIEYDSEPRIAIAHSKVCASKAIQIGAYIYALNKCDD